MDAFFVGIVVVPGITALVLLLLFAYLYQQSREGYFRAWQLGWASYTLFYVATGIVYLGYGDGAMYFLSKLLQISTVMAILVSTRLLDGERFRVRWYDVAIAIVGLGYSGYLLSLHLSQGRFSLNGRSARVELEVLLAIMLMVAAVKFYRYGRQKDYLGFRLISLAITVWAILSSLRQFHGVLAASFGSLGHVLGPMPHMLVGLAMVIVLYEHERRMVQENSLYFSTLDVDNTSMVSTVELTAGMRKLSERLVALMRVDQVAICIAGKWQNLLPSAGVGFTPEHLRSLEVTGASEYLIDMAYRRGGIVTLRNIATMQEPLPAGPQGRFDRLKEVLAQHQIQTLTALSVQTRDKNFGVLVFAHTDRNMFGPS